MDDFNMTDAELPTMVVRYNNNLVLRSVITGQYLKTLGPPPNWAEENLPKAILEKSEQIEKDYIKALEAVLSLLPCEEKIKVEETKPPTAPTEHQKNSNSSKVLPPCKVQRNYCCIFCSYYTQNPRSHLLHQREVHGVRLSIHNCPHCQYASRYFQKLKRHIKMVHTVRNPEEALTGNEAQIGPGLKDEEGNGSKSIELPINAETVIPSSDAPCCSKDISALPGRRNIQKDPEAFFVAAYKNQLRMQLELEQRVRQCGKVLNEEPSSQSTPFGLSKPPHPAYNTTKNESNIPTNLPFHITEENSTFPVEHERKRTFSCRKCNYVTHIKSRYTKHVKYHSMPMIQCNICEFRTTYKWNLTRHLRSHQSNGTYKCSVCSFSANMKQSLTSHEVNHHSPPVGRGSRSKLFRRRRCRVGGSDLQPETSEKRSPNTVDDPKEEPSIHQENPNEDIHKEENQTSPGSSDNRHENDMESSLCSENEFDCETPSSSDNEAEDSGPNKPIDSPQHDGFDFLSDGVEIGSSRCSSELSLRSITTQESDSNPAAIKEEENLEKITEGNIGRASKRSSPASTISADEGFDRNSDRTFSSSVKSSCDSEEDSDTSSGSSSISSDKSNTKIPLTADSTSSEKED